jgi:hypothetical protein
MEKTWSIPYPELDEYLCSIDYGDVKHIEASTALRPFIAGMLSYSPWWLKALFRVRQILVAVLGLEKHEDPATLPAIHPRTLPFTAGGKALLFEVRKAKEDAYWIAESPKDKHLTAFLGVVAEPEEQGLTRFHVFTTVRFKHWTGPVYFNLIRPFHHLVVLRMMKAATCSQPL